MSRKTLLVTRNYRKQYLYQNLHRINRNRYQYKRIHPILDLLVIAVLGSPRPMFPCLWPVAAGCSIFGPEHRITRHKCFMCFPPGQVWRFGFWPDPQSKHIILCVMHGSI